MTKKIGGRRTRKVNMWAKAAGEYYRSHKNDPKIKEFSDVLKSPDFKNYYMSKYGKGKSRFTKKNHTRNNKKFPKYKRESNEEMNTEDESNEEESNEDYEWVKVPKKGKKNRRTNKTKEEIKEEKEEENGWKWGGEGEVNPQVISTEDSQEHEVNQEAQSVEPVEFTNQ